MGRTCRRSGLYYYGIKFALSAYATLFSLLGLALLAAGAWAEAERRRLRALQGPFLAPAALLLLLGAGVLAVSLAGALGGLRDNRALLRTFFWVLLLIFLTELLLILVEIVFESKMNEVFHSNIQEGIRHYYDDLDFKNILDYVQEKFSCCGGDEFRDWEVNQYHRCNGSGALACGVPHSCCVRGAPGGVVNTLCGYRALEKERLELLGRIHVRGCIHAVGLWVKDNAGATLGIVCALLLPQVLGLALAWLHWQQLNELRSRWDFVDSGAGAAPLDPRGAGWCWWCLPRDGGYGSDGNGNNGDTGNDNGNGNNGDNGNGNGNGNGNDTGNDNGNDNGNGNGNDNGNDNGNGGDTRNDNGNSNGNGRNDNGNDNGNNGDTVSTGNDNGNGNNGDTRNDNGNGNGNGGNDNGNDNGNGGNDNGNDNWNDNRNGNGNDTGNDNGNDNGNNGDTGNDNGNGNGNGGNDNGNDNGNNRDTVSTGSDGNNGDTVSIGNNGSTGNSWNGRNNGNTGNGGNGDWEDEEEDEGATFLRKV